jgi:transketolase
MDAIERAASGHPGLPLGAAEAGALLFGEVLRHDPAAPEWPDRDRFVLSAGHGSMLLYALLHLAGYGGVSLEDIKNFRQPGSPAAGHPEYGLAGGIEATSGPLGQGLAMAVGMAVAESMLAARFNTGGRRIVDHRTWVLAGDGCLQEGVSGEASSLAGHFALGKLTVLYDSNRITIDGGTELAFTEDVGLRYEAYGWQVLRGSMYDFEALAALIEQARSETGKPSLIILESVIGKGAPHKENSAAAHGAPLGAEEVAAARKLLGIPAGEEGDFYAAPEARDYFKARRELWARRREEWEAEFAAWSAENPEGRREWDMFHSLRVQAAEMPVFAAGEKIATRAAGTRVLDALARSNGNLTGGSADLKGPNGVALPAGAGVYGAATPGGRYIHFGVREFAMAALCNGIQLHGGLRAFCATFLVFSDYLRGALRLSALMGQPVIYVFTHDSIYVGEDGPTHQPVEHLAGLRAIPNLRVLRPADAEECAEAWLMALERREGPTALILSRQNLPVFPKPAGWREAMRRGAYTVREPGGEPDLVLAATGSEVSLALEAAALAKGVRVRVLSVPDRGLFEGLSREEREALLPPGLRVVAAEAGSAQGWERWARPEDILSVDRFGESAPAARVAEDLGFTAGALAAMLERG